MSDKLPGIIIGVLLLALVAVSASSAVAYSRVASQLDRAERTYEAYRADTVHFVKSSGHFESSPNWASLPHVEPVKRIGASMCFDCHTETSCSDCHVNHDERDTTPAE